MAPSDSEPLEMVPQKIDKGMVLDKGWKAHLVLWEHASDVGLEQG